MNVSEFLDKAAAFDGIQVGDSQYDRRRQTYLDWLQEISDRFQLLRPFSWRLKPATLTLAGGVDFTELPADFSEVGATGSVRDLNRQGRRLTERSPIIIQSLKTAPPRSLHEEFSIFAKETAEAGDPGRLYFQIAANGSAQSFGMWYLPEPATLTDVATHLSGLDRIPAKFHFSVLLPLMRAKINEANDGLREKYEREANQGIDSAFRAHDEEGRSGVQAAPMTNPGMH